MKCGALLVLLSSLACAQPFEVRGVVTEVGGAGIADVEVTIQMVDAANQVVKTDGRGSFRVAVEKAGTYFIFGASKAGYFGSGLLGQPVVVDAGRPQVDVVLTLVRAGEVNGRVLDEETREPVAGVEIALFTKGWNYGQLRLTSATREPAVTDADGRFHIPEVRPGEYLAAARPRVAAVQVLKDFSKADVEIFDEAFPATYWPGGGDAASAFGTTLTSGGYADVGTMFVRKAPQHRVHVTMQGACAEGETARVWILSRNGGAASALGSFPCAGELLLRGFDPGSYVLYASSERRSAVEQLGATVSGVAALEVVDKNLNVLMPLQRGIVMEGQLSMADGVSAPRILPRIAMRPFDLLTGAQMENDSQIQWAPDQLHFRLAVSPRVQSFLVSDPPTGAYVKEIRYNGTPVHGSTLPVNIGAAAHKLEVVIDDKYGSLAGSVTDGSRAVVDAQVLIVKESARVEDLGAQPPAFATTNGTGTFPAVRLAPGDYRAIAVARAQQSKIHEPGVMERLLSVAQRITVTSGGTQTVTIRLSDPR